MNPFRSVTGAAAPLDRVEVDTDQIIPKQFLKRIEKTGYGDFLFFDWRFSEDGSPRADFILNREPYKSAPILLTGRNFGCGSSREHAAWALAGFGIRTVIAPSFADIFHRNCFQNGILPVTLGEEQVHILMDRALKNPEYQVTVDLENQIVSDSDGLVASFEIDPFRRRCLLEGLDDIGLTLQHLDQIVAYEEAREAIV
jgi:3-isopropylmalate/(R)-2-methylmalate dehydratase small subunit